ncbi:MocR-like transcription factor YczR [Cellulomonas terrae]|uniref:GntR family transcriptional regulator n=1 Tax=Cellulomonas terrae TaxID=311234 RepID=A0A511JG50_9CELL|nr:PLP-dependent aminotransferase family protein [Cellulomonas terrae]GEL96915.1 GntR family transcriptional regulator [Cellulomonas terrae]
MNAEDLPADRRISGLRLHAVLGAWQRPGPAYVALADALRASILSGTVPLSTRLPSERELADAAGVSRTTTTATYGLLRDEGYLVSRRGSGTVTTLPSGPGARVSMAESVGHEPGVVDLAMAAPSAPSSLHGAYLAALDALPRHLSGTGYSPLGLPVLREAVARWYTGRGTPTSPDHVLITTGAQQAIHLLVTAHAGPGDRVAVEHPTYPHAIDVVRATGARPVPVPSGGSGLDIDLLESTLRQVSPRLVYLIPDHRNPTGTSLDDEERAQVRALARRYRTAIVGDEVLTELTLDGPAPGSYAGDGTASAYVVSIGSASKSYWGGLRVGWVRAHPDLVARLASARAHTDIGTAVLEQLVVAELLAQPTDLLARRRAELRARRDLLVGLLLDQLPSWSFDVPAGGLSLWVDLGAPVSSALAAISSRHGVRVVPGTAFGVDGSFERNLRLPYTTSPDDLRRAVTGLAAAWAGLGVTAPVAGPDRVHALV